MATMSCHVHPARKTGDEVVVVVVVVGQEGGRLDYCQKGFTEATSICGHVEASGTGRKRKCRRFGVSVFAALTSCVLCCEITNH